MKRIGIWLPPGLVTFAVGIVVWKVVSLFFLPVVFPGPEVLLERMIAIYGDPASYVVVGKTLRRIFEGFAISMLGNSKAYGPVTFATTREESTRNGPEARSYTCSNRHVRGGVSPGCRGRRTPCWRPVLSGP